MDNALNKIRELNNLIEEVRLLDDFLVNFSDLDEADKLQYGCKVQYVKHDNTLGEGRVWKINPNGDVAVNRDGYASYMYFKREDLTNLSVGRIGRSERLKWVKEKQIEALKREINRVNEDFLELELSLENINQTIQIEILSINDIKNTNAKILTYKKREHTEIRKVITASQKLKVLKEGKYLLRFMLGILVSIEPIK